MRIFAIGDVHLPGGDAKPMDVFGEHWTGHFARIQADWHARVTDNDLVLLPGDISWAMRLEDALPDLAALGALPGQKVLLRGNHDYWWSSISRVRAALSPGMFALQHDAMAFEDAIICGSRGWICPGSPAFGEDDARIYAREVARLSLSLSAAEKLRKRRPDSRLVAMLHYPPCADRGQPTEVTRALTEAGVSDAVYGHLHGPGIPGAFQGMLDGVRYHLVSCDALGFALYELPEQQGPEPTESENA